MYWRLDPVHRCRNNITNKATVSQHIDRAMDVSLPNQLTYHAYIIQAAALAFAEHFFPRMVDNGLQRVEVRVHGSAFVGLLRKYIIDLAGFTFAVHIG